MTMRMRGWLVAGALALAACAGDKDPQAKPLQTEAPRAAVGTQFAEPSEAQLRAELATILRTETTGLSQVKAPSGATKVDLQGHYQSAVVARVNADGTVTTECLDSVDSAMEFLQTAPAPKAEVQ